MSSQLVTENVWRALTTATRRSSQPAAVAVAYFGQGAAKLLPLPPRSRLVVDASEAAVKSGQTCPEELQKLIKKDVRVYSIPNLHAKVFAMGRKAYVGSANVSQNSASTLVEAMIATTDPEAVEAARRFVRELCIHELGPEALGRLTDLYRPPRSSGSRGKTRRKKLGTVLPGVPRLRIVKLRLIEPPVGSEAAQEAGRTVATGRQKSPRRNTLDDFWWRGKCRCEPGEIVLQVLDEGHGRHMVSPPGTVIHTRKWRGGRHACTFVYVERPKLKRTTVKDLAKKLGRGAKARLLRGGPVREEFARRLLGAWRD